MHCRHFNPKGFPEPNTEKKMCKGAKERKPYDVCWAVVHPRHAYCHSIHRTKREAQEAKGGRWSILVVVRVAITPLYESDD